VNGDRLARWTAVTAVLAVAAVAAVISYRHAVDVVTAHGEPGTLGRLYLVTIDGLIVAASMVVLDAARHREGAPRLAWWLLGAGIGATLAVNMLAGVPSGWLGAIAAAWPAAAFVGCYELLMMLVRASARRTGAEAVNRIASDAETAAMVSLRATLAAGNPWSNNQLAERFGLTRAQAAKVRTAVLAGADGHPPGDDA
jgi:Protein of unknown function (DUF2637)